MVNILTFTDVDRYGEQTQGGYSTHIVVQEDFVLSFPNNMDMTKVAPR